MRIKAMKEVIKKRNNNNILYIIYIMKYYLVIIIIIITITIIIYCIFNKYLHRTINKMFYFIVKPNIPKIIIQTWKNNEIPDNCKHLIENVKKNNPDYEYKFFTDDDIEIFLKTYYADYYKTYKSLPKKIQKIDFFRYIAVYHYGGFYMDLDMEVFANFDDLLYNNCIFPIDDIITENMCKEQRYSVFCKQNINY